MSLYEIPSPVEEKFGPLANAIRAIMIGAGNHNAGFVILGTGTQTVINSPIFKSNMIAIIEPQNASAQGASVVLTSIVDGALTLDHSASPTNAKVGFLVFEATEY